MKKRYLCVQYAPSHHWKPSDILQYLSLQFPLKILQPQSRGQGRREAAVTGCDPRNSPTHSNGVLDHTSCSSLLSLLTETWARVNIISAIADQHPAPHHLYWENDSSPPITGVFKGEKDQLGIVQLVLWFFCQVTTKATNVGLVV